MATIRLLTENDAEAFIAIRAEALKNVPEAFATDYTEYAAMSQEAKLNQFRNSVDSDNNFIFGAFDDNNILLGIVGLIRDTHLKTQHRAFIWGVYVTEQARGLRLGRAMMSAAIEQARTMPGLEELYLSVVTVQEVARSLYLSLGFEIYGRELNALKIGDDYFDEDLMVLFLAE